MTPYRVGFIGCGRPWKSEGASGFGMSNAHADGYNASPDAKIVALADIVEENAHAFQQRNGGDEIYTDYHAMLAQANLDIVSISTWPHLHAPMVLDCARAGVKAIHCEKPMGIAYGECVEMVRVCQEKGVQLTFNHQRRFGAPFQEARRLLRSGAIGELQQIQSYCPNLYDWGTHWFDMLFFYNDETAAEWVIGQFDIRGSQRVFGALIEGHGLSHTQFANGVQAMLITGHGAGKQMVNRLLGSAGMIEVGVSQEVPLRMWGKGQSGWTTIDTGGEGIHGDQNVKRGVLDLIDALKSGREPELAGRRALQATELIFATYESSRRRGRVDLPMAITDHPMLAMVSAGLMIEDEKM